MTSRRTKQQDRADAAGPVAVLNMARALREAHHGTLLVQRFLCDCQRRFEQILGREAGLHRKLAAFNAMFKTAGAAPGSFLLAREGRPIPRAPWRVMSLELLIASPEAALFDTDGLVAAGVTPTRDASNPRVAARLASTPRDQGLWAAARNGAAVGNRLGFAWVVPAGNISRRLQKAGQVETAYTVQCILAADHYEAGDHLVALQYPQRTMMSTKAATPTFLEAQDHPWFCSKIPADYNWGSTVDLRLIDGPQPSIYGCPEAVLMAIPFDERFTIEDVGPASTLQDRPRMRFRQFLEQDEGSAETAARTLNELIGAPDSFIDALL